MSYTNQRQHIRTKFRAEVRLSHPDTGDLTLLTADISDGGVYILSQGKPLPATGEIVQVQVMGIGGDEAPLLNMKIVRSDGKGIGLEFVRQD